jgi:hypothetical protein
MIVVIKVVVPLPTVSGSLPVVWQVQRPPIIRTQVRDLATLWWPQRCCRRFAISSRISSLCTLSPFIHPFILSIIHCSKTTLDILSYWQGVKTATTKCTDITVEGISIRAKQWSAVIQNLSKNFCNFIISYSSKTDSQWPCISIVRWDVWRWIMNRRVEATVACYKPLSWNYSDVAE